MRTKTRTEIPRQTTPPHALVPPGPMPATGPETRADAPPGTTRDTRRLALAVTTVVVALGAVATFLVLVLNGPADTGTPEIGNAPGQVPGGKPFESKIPQGIDGSDARLYQRAQELQAQADLDRATRAREQQAQNQVQNQDQNTGQAPGSDAGTSHVGDDRHLPGLNDFR